MNILRGGKTITVRCNDGTEDVLVRELPIRQLPEWLASLDDEVVMVKLTTGRDDAWVDALDRESFLALVDAATEVNQAFFAGIVRRRLARTDELVPGLAARMQESAVNAVRNPTSNGGSPTSPRPAG
jgi:hypothetical protein